MNLSPPSSGNSAVTVVEILVVAAVVGVLAALLLPAIESTREGSRKTRCVGNLRQIGLVWQMKVADSDQRIPKIANNWWLWGGFDPGQLNPRDTPSISSRIFTPEKEPSLTINVFICPSDQRNSAFSNPTPTWKRMGTSYAPNPYVWYNVGVSPIVKTVFDIVEPQRTILLGDATIHIPGYVGVHPGADGRFTWHTNPGGGFKNNILFCDGRVAFVQIGAGIGSSPEYKWLATN